MTQKLILIVDDEEAILSVLKSSLKKLGPEYAVTTVTNGTAALELLDRTPFDLVVTDYKMTGMNGLELLESIRVVRPETRVIMMTAYSSPVLETETQRLNIYRYLTKPLEISAFRQMVKEALEENQPEDPGPLVPPDERRQRINQLLLLLQSDVGSRCVFLCDAEGQVISRVGSLEPVLLEQVARVMRGSMTALLEAGRVMDGNPDTTNLAYREGEVDNLYAINIGRELLLILICERGPYSVKLSSVWYYAQQAATHLRQELAPKECNNPKITRIPGAHPNYDLPYPKESRMHP